MPVLVCCTMRVYILLAGSTISPHVKHAKALLRKRFVLLNGAWVYNMGLQMLSVGEMLTICRTINSYSTMFDWMTDEPFFIDETTALDPKYLPSTNPALGYAVIPMFVDSGFETFLKQRYGGDANIMSFLNTQSSLAEEKGDKFELDWSLRFFKDKKFFKTNYAVQSNLMPNMGNTGIMLGTYERLAPSDPIHNMFSDMR